MQCGKYINPSGIDICPATRNAIRVRDTNISNAHSVALGHYIHEYFPQYTKLFS